MSSLTLGFHSLILSLSSIARLSDLKLSGLSLHLSFSSPPTIALYHYEVRIDSSYITQKDAHELQSYLASLVGERIQVIEPLVVYPCLQGGSPIKALMLVRLQAASHLKFKCEPKPHSSLLRLRVPFPNTLNNSIPQRMISC
ncbi:hypothetical protein BKA67DRAFT_29969 [Truncatella angustata]|uniref:Uncharacterized protein n=1 Tax=Truncatella angustata TaxID=152316 RepID=A0A9P8UX37_9PEZI|nr:uncharacterized protein BKA67DRAFT_29969 [Truncatella angustata]KAH6659827.1 hypothetical protein BKA67DRAFT_29969 [Truncatella angustata]